MDHWVTLKWGSWWVSLGRCWRCCINNKLPGIPDAAAGSQITLWIAGGYSQPMSYCLAKWTFMKWIRVSGQGYHNQVWPERPLSPVAFDSNSFLFYHLTLIIYCLMLLVTMLCCLIFQTKLKVPRVEESSCITFCIIAPILNFHLLTD